VAEIVGFEPHIEVVTAGRRNVQWLARDVPLTSAEARMLPGTDLGGDPAPGFSLPDLDGRPVRLADLQGKVVLLFYWATW